jgi:tetratricopeptide (TPR) repeat protein
MENTPAPRAPLELSLVDIDPTPEEAAAAASSPLASESVTLQPIGARPPRAPAPAIVSPTTVADAPTSADPIPPTSVDTPLTLVSDLPPVDTTAESTDRFLAAATREYAAGRIDQPLWMRAAAQSGGNEATARDAYLRARATALKLTRRERRADTQGGGGGARIGANLPGRAIAGDFPAPTSKRKHAALAAVAVAVIAVVVIAGWWFAGGPTDAGPTHAAAVPAAGKPTRSAAAATPARPVEVEDHAKYFGTKIADLKDAGNWNVLVLYAAEWTRKQPDSATAWKELSIGYSNLRQFDDALQAATKSTQLTPADAGLWRNLAQINLALEQPEAALVALDKAMTLDAQDLSTLVLAGNVSLQLDHTAEARAAFDKVLAANPEHVGALCGKASVAVRQKQTKEAEAIGRQIKAVDGQCRDNGETAAIAVATAPQPNKATAARNR